MSCPQIHFNHARIGLDLVHAAFRQNAALMQHGDLFGDGAHKGHVMLDHDHRMLAGQRGPQQRGQAPQVSG